jgi:hypothetical protein
VTRGPAESPADSPLCSEGSTPGDSDHCRLMPQQPIGLDDNCLWGEGSASRPGVTVERKPERSIFYRAVDRQPPSNLMTSRRVQTPADSGPRAEPPRQVANSVT